jgi:hypothetical protein
MESLRAELSREGEYLGVVILSSDERITVDMFDPTQQEQVERVFREVGPKKSFGGYGGNMEEHTRYGDAVWFEWVLSNSLKSEGYEYTITKIPERPPAP